MAYQLRVDLNCTHEAPVPHSDVASFIANVTLAADSEEVVGGGWSQPTTAITLLPLGAGLQRPPSSQQMRTMQAE